MMQSVAVHVPAGAGTFSDRSGSGTVKRKNQGNFDLLLDNFVGSGKLAETKDVRVTYKAGQENTDMDSVAVAGIKPVQAKANDIVKGQMPDEQLNEDSGYAALQTLAGQIMAMLDQIRNALANALEVTGEELDRMMEELGLDAADLLDMQAIKQLVLYSSGAADSTVLLLDEQMNETFRSLAMIVEDIKREANLPMLTGHELEQIINAYGMELNEDSELNAYDMIKTGKDDIDVDGEAKPDSGKSTDAGIIRTGAEGGDYTELKVNVTSGKNTGSEDSNDREESFDAADGFEAFLNRLDAGYEKSVTEVSENTVRLFNIREVAREIIEQVRIMARPGQATMELRLYPEHLGRVSITISSDREGVMSARFVVQNEPAREAMEGQMISLKETLAQQGIKVESIEVTVAGYSFEQNGRSDEQDNMHKEKSDTGRKITFEEAVAMSEEPAQEGAVAGITGVSGNNIDYTA